MADMTPDDVAARVHAIALIAKDGDGDDEAAHGMEDTLHQSVLAAIRDGKCADPAACAAEALKTTSLTFERWCA